jgi:fructokinase
VTGAVDIAGTGFAVLDRVYPTRGSSYETLGGSCGNVLISLAMLQRAVFPLLLLGADHVGDQLVSEFEEAGADTEFIFRRPNVGSPILAQQVDTDTGQHTFSFICPETEALYPRYRPIDDEIVRAARTVLDRCSIFYADRVSAAIVDAMETAAAAGAVIYFEPSAVGDMELFERAVRIAKVVKFSADRLEYFPALNGLSDTSVLIMTKGVEGLELHQGGATYQCEAYRAPFVADTCGSGDMVSVAIIDRLLARREDGHPGVFLPEEFLREIVRGVSAGQRLAAANCAYVGARGFFRQRGVEAVRQLLDEQAFYDGSQLDLFERPSAQPYGHLAWMRAQS